MNKLFALSALAVAALTGCTSIDKYHEGPAYPQEGLQDLSSNPYVIDYRVEPQRKSGTGRSECWCWFFSSSDGLHMSPPGITFDSGLRAAKESATYSIVEKANADALVGALYKYTKTSKWLGFYQATDVEVVGFPAHVEKVTMVNGVDRPVVISKDQQVIRIKPWEKIDNQTVVSGADASKKSASPMLPF